VITYIRGANIARPTVLLADIRCRLLVLLVSWHCRSPEWWPTLLADNFGKQWWMCGAALNGSAHITAGKGFQTAHYLHCTHDQYNTIQYYFIRKLSWRSLYTEVMVTH